MQPGEHLGDDTIAAFVRGELEVRELARLESHIDGCASCHELVGAVARGQLPGGSATLGGGEPSTLLRAGDELHALERGTAIGRYLVLGPLGEGGMGVVVLAYDPELDRRVAIKLLRGATARDPELASQRLRREAQAMARLSHRNVVAVFDVGVHEDRVFVAMEYVEGGTLAGHLAAAERGPSEIVALFVEVAHGLQAAHHAGIVHRDVKPSNVLLGAAPRPRVVVTDFGLARREQERELSSELPGTPSISLVSRPLTEAGALLGTPAYMSPEQYAGADVDARSDQFSWCVALWQALYRELPFGGRTLAELAAAVETGTIRTPTRVRVHDRVDRALRRGLARDPAARFPDMDALLAAIEPRPVRGRVMLGSAAVAVLAVPLVLTRTSAPTDPCAGAEQALASVWDETRRDAMRSSFVALVPGRGELAATRVIERLDAHRGAFVASWRDACEASSVRHEQSQQAFDLRMTCLDRKRRATAAIVDVWSTLPDAAAVDRVAAATEELPRVEPCADLDGLQQAVPLPDDPQLRERIAAARDRLAEAFALQQAGRQPQAARVADAVEADIAELDYAPLRAESALRVGYVRANLGDDAAAEALWSAVGWAGAARDDATLARAMALLVGVEGVRRRHFESAHAIVRAAEAVLQRLGDPASARALMLEYEARVYEAEGEPERARPLHERALALREQSFGPRSIEVAASLQGLGRVARQQADPTRAAEHWSQARELLVEALGPVHPDVAAIELNLGVARHDLGDAVAARRHYERALAVDSEIYGADAMQVANDLHNLAVVLEEQAPPSLALAYHARALALREAADPRSAATGRSLHSTGVARELVGDFAGAMEDDQRALVVLAAALGDTHPDVARVRITIANLAHTLGDTDVAIASARRAHDDLALALGDAHTEVAIADVAHGNALLAAGDREGAAVVLRRALAVFEAALPDDHPHLAATLDVLATSLAPGDRPAAITAIERALTIASAEGFESMLRARVELTAAQLHGTDEAPRARALLADARPRLVAALPRTSVELAELECIEGALARGRSPMRARCGTIWRR